MSSSCKGIQSGSSRLLLPYSSFNKLSRSIPHGRGDSRPGVTPSDGGAPEGCSEDSEGKQATSRDGLKHLQSAVHALHEEGRTNGSSPPLRAIPWLDPIFVKVRALAHLHPCVSMCVHVLVCAIVHIWQFLAGHMAAELPHLAETGWQAALSAPHCSAER